MSDEMMTLSPREMDDMQARMLDMAHREAAALRTAGLHGSADEHFRRALAEAVDMRARALRPAAPSAPPTAPPAAPVPTAPPATGPLAAPGTPPPAAIPTEQEPGESLGAFFIRRGVAARAARQPAANPALDLSQPMGLRPRR